MDTSMAMGKAHSSFQSKCQVKRYNKPAFTTTSETPTKENLASSITLTERILDLSVLNIIDGHRSNKNKILRTGTGGFSVGLHRHGQNAC
jgi:hypothetical protein